jgi:hypothetical protein
MGTNDGVFLDTRINDILIRGMPKVFWRLESDYLEQFMNKNFDMNKNFNINNNNLASNVAVTKPKVIDKDLSIRGGIRAPHLHYNGEIYLLNKEQWNEFSGGIIKEFSKKLAETKNVSFNQLMELSDVMSEIA